MNKSASNIPLGNKIFFTLCGVIFITSLTASISIYKGASNSLLERLRAHLTAIPATSVLQIKLDDFNNVIHYKDKNSSAYKRIQKTLIDITNANPDIKFSYTMRPLEEKNKWAFVVDGDDNKKTSADIDEEFDSSENPMMTSALKKPSADKKLTSDKWGTWISAYAPLKNADGKTIGIVGVDMSAKKLQAEMGKLKAKVIWNVLLSLVLAIVLSLIVTKIILTRIKTFTTAALRITDGELDFAIPVSGTDEIAIFTKTFNSMICGLKESRERMLEVSSIDILTNLFNHMYFHERLASEIERAQRYKHDLSLMIIDLDRFKSINDNLGHPVGDSLLNQLATLFKANMRSVDIVCRYGGDEFSIILPETSSENAVIAAEELRKAVESHTFSAVPISELLSEHFRQTPETSIHLTVTIGVSTYPEANITKDGLFMAADIALRRAKHIERNSVGAFDPVSDGNYMIDPNDVYHVMNDMDGADIKLLNVALDAKDEYSYGHSEKVANYALDLGESINCEEEMLNALKIAGLLHDLGKIGVSDEIADKPGSLTKEERNVINQHPSIGGKILKQVPDMEQILPAVLFHHERWDGTGYPNGLSGDSIPLIARILSIADAYDAMTSNRSYRKALSVEGALTELRAGKGTQFDPELTEAFISLIQKNIKKAA